MSVESAPITRINVNGEEVVVFLGYAEVKQILRDYKTFSSATPFRVPIPSEEHLRPTAQYPIESDPPEHTAYRGLLEEHFSRKAVAQHRPAVEAFSHELLDTALAVGRFDAVGDYALALFLRALALTLGLPLADIPRWQTWGIQALSAETTPGISGNSDMNRYIDETVDRARANAGDDFFGHLARSTIADRPVTRDEMRGFGNLAFAGGRQTVVYSLSSALDYLSRNPIDTARLKADPDRIPRATEEFLRWMTPIVHLGRTVTTEVEIGGVRLNPGDLVSVCYARANRDASVFDSADDVVVDRKPNRHFAFGHGAHTCSGAPLARMVIEVAIYALLNRTASIEPTDDVAPRIETLGNIEFRVGFDRLVLFIT